MVKIAERYVSLIENSKAPLGNFVLVLVAFITLRNFLEIFSDRSEVSVISFEGHLHYYLFYICVALTMILLFSAATGETAAKTTRLILFSYFFILLAPIFDLIISLGQGYDMSYLFPHEHENLLLRYLTLGGSLEGGGITIGQRLEGILLMAASFFYVKVKRATNVGGLLFVLVFYTVVFIYAIMPFIIQTFLKAFGLLECLADNMLFAKFYLVLAFVLLLILAWKWNKKYCVSILKDIRPFRQLHAQLMFVLGVMLSPRLVWGQDTPFDFALIAISIGCACLFVIITNNLEDYEIDRATNKSRPLVIGAIPPGDYRMIAVGAGLLALAYSGAMSYYAFFAILLCMGLYSLYSMPPVRLKRVPLLSKLLIALSSLASVIMGYVFGGGEVIEFPPLITLWFLVFFAAAINFIDIKDYEEDRRAGIQTLPVLWKLGKSKLVIGLSFLLAYLTAPFAFGYPGLLAPALVLGIVQCWLVNRESYREDLVLFLYLLSLLVLLVYSHLV